MSQLIPPLAHVTGLTVTFRGRNAAAVDSVSFSVHSGECVAIVGESGSGKTLTAKALLGLLPESAKSSGRIQLQGRDAPARGAAAWNAIRGRVTALVPQNALGSLDPLRRVEHEVGDALRLHRLTSRGERRERVVTALRDAAMPTPERYLRARADELSGGLKQRALVASALIADPTLIVADEPTTALDASHRSRVLQQLRTRADHGAGLVLISHDLESVRNIADRVLVMRHGRIVEAGTAEQIFARPAHPFTRELLAASTAGKQRSRPTAYEPTLPPKLELRDVSACYAGSEAKVLREASLRVHANETVGLVGESGSGKTTLLRIALGLHPLDSGNVLITGRDRNQAGRHEQRMLRRRIALVPQDPLDSFPPGAVAAAILEDALRAAATPKRDRTRKALALAEEVGLDAEQLRSPAATLSGGQRQRLALARALARDPEILLLDEPVSALDLTVQAKVLELLNQVQRSRHTAMLLVSHDEDVISYMSDRVLRLESGTLHAQ